MNVSHLFRLYVHRLALGVLLCLFGFSASDSLGNGECEASSKQDVDPAESPFVWLEKISDTVDGALVLNNPAERFLLSDPDGSARQLLSMSGFLFNTHDAFDSLIHAFGDETQETMRALFSKHVVLVWDGVGVSPVDPLAMLKSGFDLEWTIVCEVDPEHIEQLRAGIHPTRRNIEHGQTIFAIENGRYNVLLLSEQTAGFESMVVLAPKKSMPLFQDVISAYFSKVDTHRPLVDGREQLIAQIPEIEGEWAAACVMQIGEPSGADRLPAFVGALSSSSDGMSGYFAMDYEVDALPPADAPVGLLGAMEEGAVAAIAMATTPGFEIEDHSIEASFPFFNQQVSSTESSAEKLTGGPGLLFVEELADTTAQSGAGQRSLGMTLYAQFVGSQSVKEQPLARRVDRVMHELVAAFDFSRPPIYQGKFPHAIRTHHVNYEQSQVVESDEDQAPTGVQSWPGSNPKLSWISTNSSGEEGFIVSFTPSWANSAKQVRTMRTAYRTVESLVERPQRSGVITAGYIQPSRFIDLMGTSSDEGLMLFGMFDRVSWKISRASFGVRGHIGFSFTSDQGMQGLGENTPHSR